MTPSAFTRIVFLDFDGVLHIHARGTFDRLPLLSDWLAQHPHIGVVISSTWRLLHELEELREFFPTAVRHQVVDVTPDLCEPDGLIILARSRLEEIQAWLRCHPQVERWVALDDEVRLFPGGLEHVVLTAPAEALTPSHLEEVARRLDCP